MEPITVIKRDGKREAFDPEKMKLVCLAAGLEPTQADQATSEMQSWLANSHTTEINSTELRDKLVIVMKHIHEPAAQMFVWYESTKDKRPTTPQTP